MSKAKPVFHEFDPIIYPFKIWVATNPEYSQVARKFLIIDSSGNIDNFREKDLSNPDNSRAARTFVVSNKIDQMGVFICVFSKREMTAKYIAHESAHCADFFAEQLGLTTGKFYEGEAYAYLIGWITNCIERAIKYKPKKKKKKQDVQNKSEE